MKGLSSYRYDETFAGEDLLNSAEHKVSTAKQNCTRAVDKKYL